VQGVAAQFASGKYGPMRCAAAIIGSADLAQHGAAVEPLLEACKAASPNYRGIRLSASHDPRLPKGANFCASAHLYAEETFRAGFALLHKHGLIFDAWVYGCQLPDVLDLATAFPQTTIVLNHIGTPVGALGNVAGAPECDGQQEAVIAQWKESMSAIAHTCPHVYVKVGGLALPMLGHGLTTRDKPASSEEVAALFSPLYLWTISTFGASRCMLEGNFPVDKVAMSYTTLWNAHKRITRDLPGEERGLLFSGTAKKVYRL